MNPAYSVIFFTTASGAGYGLLILFGIFNAIGLLPEDRWFGLIGLGISLMLITTGLLSSTFHLGRPERAWRAFSQWRTSWLSREGVAAVITYCPAILFGTGWVYLGNTGGIWAVFGLLSSLGAVITIYCTGMIYASLKAIPAWNHKLVTPGYILLGLLTGSLIMNTLLFVFTEFILSSMMLTFTVIVSGLILKYSYWYSIDVTSPVSNLKTATGLSDGVKVLDPPHTSTNYLQTEMGYKIARKHSQKLRFITLITLFVTPLVLGAIILVFPFLNIFLGALSLLSAGLGVIIERWLFFAEARHVVSLYYD